MMIDEAVAGMRDAPANRARLIVRLVKKKPTTLKQLTLKREKNGSVTLWTRDQRPARPTTDDKRRRWVVLNTDMVKDPDLTTSYIGALLQAAARCEGREMTDDEAMKMAQLRSLRNQHAVFVI